ncbi:MAG: hypothetical protein ACRCUY_01980 [Thermoguttaceae bacterium]
MGIKKFMLVAAFILSALFTDLSQKSVCAAVFASDTEAESLYGKAVHAFFDQNYRESVQLLTQVEKLGSEDPRPYYFMALAHQRMKKEDKADIYFKKAAQLEQEGETKRDYDVSNALKRIQGKERLGIEKYRKEAKLEFQNREDRRKTAKYANNKQDGLDVVRTMSKYVGQAPFGAISIDPLRTETGSEPESMIDADDTITEMAPKSRDKSPRAIDQQISETAKKSDTAAEKDDEENPFGTADKKKSDTAAEKDDEENPFGTADTKKSDTAAEKDDEDNPFGTADAKKSDTAAEKDDEENPFGTADTKKSDTAAEKDDEENPFGTTDKKKSDAAEPKKSDATEDDDNPFL